MHAKTDTENESERQRERERESEGVRQRVSILRETIWLSGERRVVRWWEEGVSSLGAS